MTDPTPTTMDEETVQAVIAAIHEGLGGTGWAYSNYGGDEQKYMAAELRAAALAAIQIVQERKT